MKKDCLLNWIEFEKDCPAFWQDGIGKQHRIENIRAMIETDPSKWHILFDDGTEMILDSYDMIYIGEDSPAPADEDTQLVETISDDYVPPPVVGKIPSGTIPGRMIIRYTLPEHIQQLLLMNPEQRTAPSATPEIDISTLRLGLIHVGDFRRLPAGVSGYFQSMPDGKWHKLSKIEPHVMHGWYQLTFTDGYTRVMYQNAGMYVDMSPTIGDIQPIEPLGSAQIPPPEFFGTPFFLLNPEQRNGRGE